VLKSRIIALALIGIMLSSPSVSLVDAYTIWTDVNEINGVPIMLATNSQYYKIKLFDKARAMILDLSTIYS